MAPVKTIGEFVSYCQEGSLVDNNENRSRIALASPRGDLSDADYLAEIRAIKGELAETGRGLSLAHISTRQAPIAAARLALGGRVMRIWASSAATGERSPCLIRVPLTEAEGRGHIVVRCEDGVHCWVKVFRGVISGFSRQSRGRLLQRLASLDRRDRRLLPALVTLTYPGQFPEDGRVWKRHLEAFKMRLEREYGRIPGFWKLEFQTRGAPHFHLLLYDERLRLHQHAFKMWLSRAWYEIVGSGDERHLRAGTNVELPRYRRKVESYASKYVGKPETGIEGVGRYWGVWYKDLLPVEILQVAVELPEFHRLRRVLRGLLRRRVRRPGRWAFLGERDALKLLHFALGGLSPPAIVPGRSPGAL